MFAGRQAFEMLKQKESLADYSSEKKGKEIANDFFFSPKNKQKTSFNQYTL